MIFKCPVCVKAHAAPDIDVATRWSDTAAVTAD